MKVLVTGATGFIGAAVARRLAKEHEVLALSRSDAASEILRAAGLTPVEGDFADPASLAVPAAMVDGIVSTASIGQVGGAPNGFDLDRQAVAVMTGALGNSGRPLIFTSGSAIFGVFTKGEASPTVFAEDHPAPLPADVVAPPEAEVPPPFVEGLGGAMAPRAATEAAVMSAPGVRGIAIRPGLVYGDGKGYDLPNLFALTKAHGSATPHLGSGHVRQGYVHIDDLVELYILALSRAEAGTMLHGVTDEVSMGDLADAVSRRCGFGGKTEAQSLMEMFGRGGPTALSLALNKRLASDKTRKLTGWAPKRRDILADVEHGSYAA